MTLAEALYTAIQEIRDGGIGEIEIEEECDLDEHGRTIRLTVTVRRHVQPICIGPVTG